MFTEFFRALFTAGIPIALASYLLAWWALKNNYLGAVKDVKGLEKEFKRLSKAKSKGKKKAEKDHNPEDAENIKNMSLAHKKWFSFGGGFYGVVALVTYIVVELFEIRDFIANFGGLIALISNITVDLFINLIIDSFMNFVLAIAWPMYWLNEIDSQYIWIWFAVAYLGYWSGIRFALHQAGIQKP
jgi:hypothetical protein